jgi:hypothetical protein
MLDPRPGAPVVSNPPTSDVQQRWRADRDAIAAQDPWQHSPEKTVMMKMPDGTVVARPRTGADGAPDQTAPGEARRPGEPQPLTSDGRIQLTKDIAVTEQELHDLLAHKAATESAKLSTPKPNEYKLEFPHDYVLPAGVEWKWNEADPLLAQVREFASASGMSQDTFSKLLGLHAASGMRDIQEFSAARENQVKLLGENANARVDQIKIWLKSMVPEHFDGLAKVLEMAPTAATVKGLEVLIHRYVSQGSGGLKGNREAQTCQERFRTNLTRNSRIMKSYNTESPFYLEEEGSNS